MTIALNKCVKCSGELVSKIIDKEYNVNGQKIIIPNVPVMECVNCKEQYLNSDTSKYIFDQIRKLRSGEIDSELEVNIKEIRNKKGLTQEEVAKKLGFSIARFSEIERNKKIPSVLLSLKIAQALECDINELYKLKTIIKI